jgi:hypothetical protein
MHVCTPGLCLLEVKNLVVLKDIDDKYIDIHTSTASSLYDSREKKHGDWQRSCVSGDEDIEGSFQHEELRASGMRLVAHLNVIAYPQKEPHRSINHEDEASTMSV